MVAVVWLVAASASADNLPGGNPPGDLEVLMETLSVSGREELAATAILERLPPGLEGRERLGERDALGNVVVTLGAGEPRRLLACGMDEPGLVVSEIRDDGYLRLRPAGSRTRSPLWVQSFEGQKVWISTAQGRVAAAVAIPSVHLIQDGPPSDAVVGLGSVFVDVGAETAAEVREQGIRMLDPVGLQQRMTRIGSPPGGTVTLAGPAAQSKAGCAALLAVTRGLAEGSVDGTLVVAWLRLELWNRKGIEYLVRQSGPFGEVLLASRGFGWSRGDDGVVAAEMPDIGSGPMSSGDVVLSGATTDVEHVPPNPAWYTGGPDWGQAKIGYFAVPARYRGTPVETIALEDLGRLQQAIAAWAGDGVAIEIAADSATEPVRQIGSAGAESAALLADLVGTYGVSTREAAMRAAVRERLPAWAQPVIDERGNLLVEFGAGDEHVAFVAHLDEVGFTVEEILADGRLRVVIKGGLSPSAWEAQSAVVHTGDGPLGGVFEPRPGWLEAESRRPAEALTVFVGTDSAQETVEAGVQVGDAVTMPKRMRRLGRHRAVARAFDDRVGSTAQLLALARIDPESVERRYTFAWVVEEEIGLFGSVALAADIGTLDRIHAIDTFVASDDPYPEKGFALTPLGKGVVLRAMDNGYIADRRTIDYVQSVAAERDIPTQIGFTGGGSDGNAFIQLGATNLPLSWPGRYSHSPVEVMDLRDLESLVDLIVALVEDPPS